MPVKIFGHYFIVTFLFLTIAELLSLIGYFIPSATVALIFVVTLIVLVISLRKLEYGLYALVAELAVGGQGHLLTTNFHGVTISIRQILFAIVLVTWVISKVKSVEKINKQQLLVFIPLAVAIGLGLILGFFRNQPANVFFDANAWLYFILAPVIIDVVKTKKIVGDVVQVLAGATTFISVQTVMLLILFSHNVTGVGGVFYHWLRDSAIGEVTYMSGTLFRIFLPSQIYVLILFLVITLLWLNRQSTLDKKNLIGNTGYLYLTSLALLISQSRSYWVGGLAGVLALITLSSWKLKSGLVKPVLAIVLLIITVWSQLLLIQVLTGNFAGNPITKRFTGLDTEPASLSRLNQLPPLADHIAQKPLFGWGFGKELTYISADPRIVKKYPGGVYTTDAFEWGYLDIWLKLGFWGLAAYGILIFSTAKKIIKNPTVLSLGLLAGLAALLATNMFSPYLNHPLGIGYILLVAAISNIKSLA